LILHQHFNTPAEGGALRSYYLAKALVCSGFHPVVITGRGENEYKSTVLEGIEIHYLPIAYDNRFGFWKRSLSFLSYAWHATRQAAQIRDVKICYAISVPLTVGLAARSIKFFNKIPFIFEVGDLWPDAPIQMGFVRNYFFKWFLFQFEKSIYSEAQCIVALSDAIRTNIQRKIRHKKVHVIPNMADTDFYLPEPKDPLLEKRFNTKEKFVVSYIGAVGLANGLDFFMECARASQKADLAVKFLLCGDGAMLEGLKRIALQYQLTNLEFVSFRSRDGVREVMNVTDASFICYKPLPVLETGSPNKYFDGLSAGKLILVNFGGWIKEEIEAKQCGTYIDIKRPADFVKKVEPFIKDEGLLKQYQQAARELAESQYSRKMLSDKFVSLFTQAVVSPT
jgi:glycosyltransferase involved in cell wall biosynthesis